MNIIYSHNKELNFIIKKILDAVHSLKKDTIKINSNQNLRGTILDNFINSFFKYLLKSCNSLINLKMYSHITYSLSVINYDFMKNLANEYPNSKILIFSLEGINELKNGNWNYLLNVIIFDANKFEISKALIIKFNPLNIDLFLSFDDNDVMFQNQPIIGQFNASKLNNITTISNNSLIQNDTWELFKQNVENFRISNSPISEIINLIQGKICKLFLSKNEIKNNILLESLINSINCKYPIVFKNLVII